MFEDTGLVAPFAPTLPQLIGLKQKSLILIFFLMSNTDGPLLKQTKSKQ